MLHIRDKNLSEIAQGRSSETRKWHYSFQASETPSPRITGFYLRNI